MELHTAWTQLLQLLRAEMVVAVGGTAAIVGFQLLIGKIKLKALFADEHGGIQVWRVQFLIVALLVAGFYLAVAASAAAPVKIAVYLIFAGSNLLFLIRKFRLSSNHRREN